MTQALIFPAIVFAYLLVRGIIGYFDDGGRDD